MSFYYKLPSHEIRLQHFRLTNARVSSRVDADIALWFYLIIVHIPSRDYENVTLRFCLTNFRESNWVSRLSGLSLSRGKCVYPLLRESLSARHSRSKYLQHFLHNFFKQSSLLHKFPQNDVVSFEQRFNKIYPF